MQRFLLRIAALSPGFLVALAAMAASSPSRVLDAGRHHLGIAELPEWAEFEASPPEGRQLDLTFSAAVNAEPATLFVRQRDVKATWQVSLNGQLLGTLETLSQPLIRALTIPAGALRAGANRLTIARPPSPMLDDIVVGEIVLDPRPRATVLTQATVDLTVTERGAEGRADPAPVPCRLTLVDSEGALVPLLASPAEQRLAVRTGVVYSGDGRARLGLRPGDYTIYASRGFAYSVATARFTVGAGEVKALALTLRREIPTPGLIAADTHIHTLTYSGHGDATIDERMLTIAGEGIDLAVATDHNHNTDYIEAATRAGVAPLFRSVVGNEVTTAVGHFNAFPVHAADPIPSIELTDWPHLLQHIRSVTDARVVTLNHPRDLHAGFIPFAPEHFNNATGDLRLATPAELNCDAIEVVTSAALQSDPMLLFHDWFALVNRGYRVSAIAASDTHHVSEFILGQARTYVVAGGDTPATIDLERVWSSFKTGRLLVSFGLLTTMTVGDRFGVGDLATGLGEEIRVVVDVFGPSWVTADRVELFANGVRLREETITPAMTAGARKARMIWRLPRPPRDTYLVAIATGPGVTAPFWETPHPYQPTSKIFAPRLIGATNPIWLDADGDGKFTLAHEP